MNLIKLSATMPFLPFALVGFLFGFITVFLVYGYYGGKERAGNIIKFILIQSNVGKSDD